MTERSAESHEGISGNGDAVHRTRSHWHRRDIQEIARHLRADLRHGLTDDTARERLLEFGSNVLAMEKPRGLAAIVGAQFTDFMIVILIVAAVISGLMGELGDTLTIGVIVVLNATIGAIQEFRAQRAIEALRKMSAVGAVVIRGGKARRVSASDVVPGDLVVLEAGSVVPADLRLTEVVGLAADESTLTGESLPVDKHPHPVRDEGAPVGDRRNMAYKSTSITSGRGRGLVVATGAATEVGRIASLLAGARRFDTPLQRRLRDFSHRLAALIVLVCAGIFVIGWLGGESPQLMFLIALSLAVAAIPEALPAVVTVSLALGARKLSSRNSLVRTLTAVESLGSITCICTDKTGTLTENRMTVAKLTAGGVTASGLDELPPPVAEPLGRAMALCNDIEDPEHGDPTELALIASAASGGYAMKDLKEREPTVTTRPFDADRKLMTTVHSTGRGALAYTKGAPEQVIAACTTVMDREGGPSPLADPAAVLDQAHRVAADGYRILAFAMRRCSGETADAVAEELESGMTLIGLAMLHDPVRSDVPDAIAECRAAGIKTIMITGDHPATARKIALEIGLTVEPGAVITGQALAKLSDDALRERAEDTLVYARVDPAQKIRIVEALQANGELVAMTGDGVNDAPALRQATIGVAMGQRGTDVARETADLVLLDDNFATIVTAIGEGRRIYGNIRKFIRYTMTSNTGEIAVLLFAGVLALPVPLLPIHILWINLVTDGLPGLAFSAEPAEPNVMRQPPRPPRESVFARGLWQHMVWMGLLLAALALGTRLLVAPAELMHWQTMVFTTLVSTQLFQALALRSETLSLFRLGWLGNPWMLATVSATLLLQVLVIYVPFFNVSLHTVPLPMSDLLVCLGLGLVVVPTIELQKWVASWRK